MTPSALIEHCAKALTDADVSFGQGTLQAADEAAWLVLWKLGLPLDIDTHTLLDDLPDASVQAVLGLLTNVFKPASP
jgi:ribosomal protein L3 glutamine methyltransferase